MKKFIALVLILVFAFSLSGCISAEHVQNDSSDSTASLIIEQPINTAKEIDSIVNDAKDAILPQIEETFFEDDCYIYKFGTPISQYVIVKYTDNTTEDVKTALERGNIKITDLKKFDINYFAEPKHIKNIAYPDNWGDALTVLEEFYRDGEYIYNFPSVYNGSLMVYYKDGTEQSVKDALAEGKIRISDLDWFGIQYYKAPIN